MIWKKSATRFYIPGVVLTLTGLTVSVFSTASIAGATPLTGFGSAILQAGNGSVLVNGLGVTSGCIVWYNGAAPTACPATPGTGSFSVQGGSTAPFTVGDVGTIDDLPFNPALPLVGFMVINNAPNVPATIEFDLKDIRTNGSTALGGCTGAAATSPGDTCTMANSPFTLTNGLIDPGTGVVDTVSITLTMDAWGYTGSSGTNYNAATPYIGSFTTQQAIQGANIQSILNTIQSGGSVTASWSATFTPGTVTPEPESLFLAGLGLLALGCLRRNAQKV
jgi:hypothetical protein